jgi:N-acetyl-anhydromuramyl-L-alanine amidase AmpD
MNPTQYHFKLTKTNRPVDVLIPELWYPDIRNYWSICTSKRTVDPIDGIVAVVIHATAGASSSGAISVMKAGHASFHWLVPDENEAEHGKSIWACAPEAKAAWHVRASVSNPSINGGRSRVNHWSLGIEVVNTQADDLFSDWQVQVTADIVRYCWAKYPNLTDIVSHAKLDPARRTDPGSMFPWDKFKNLVLKGKNEKSVLKSLKDVPSAKKIQKSSKKDCCM